MPAVIIELSVAVFITGTMTGFNSKIKGLKPERRVRELQLVCSWMWRVQKTKNLL